MKKRMLFVGMAALVMMAASCKKNENGNNNGLTFKASIETDGSKTHLFDTYKVAWNNADEITVATAAKTATYSCAVTDANNTQVAEFTSENGVEESEAYLAFYPAGRCTGINVNDNKANFTMPDEQSYVNGTFDNNLNPMVAKANGGAEMPDLFFRNVFGILQVNATGNVGFNFLRLTNNNQVLSGDFAVECADPYTVTTTGTGHVITLNLGEYKSLSAEAQPFCFVLPPHALNGGFTLEFLDGDVVIKAIEVPSTATGLDLARNTIKKIDVDVTIAPEYRGIMVSDTQVIKFAPGNLQYNAAQDKWRFAEHQYDFIGGAQVEWGNAVNGWLISWFDGAQGDAPTITANNTPLDSVTIYKGYNSPYNFGGVVRETQDAWIDMFGWGTSGKFDNELVTIHKPYGSSETIQGMSQRKPWNCLNNNYEGGNYDYAYGPATGDIDGTDWAWEANDMHNYDLTDSDYDWRTLNATEWEYLINHTGKYGYAQFTDHGYTDVNGRERYLSGFVFLPIGFADPMIEGKSFVTVAQSGVEGDFSDNEFTEETWAIMEEAGAAFIPAAGGRGVFGCAEASQPGHGGIALRYWTSTASNDHEAKCFHGENFGDIRIDDSGRSAGLAVRLARNIDED